MLDVVNVLRFEPPEDAHAPVFERMAARVRSEVSWTYQEAACDHSPHVTYPHEVARLLLELA